MQPFRIRADDLGHDLALGASLDIRAGQGGRRVEELRPSRRFIGHRAEDGPRPGFQAPPGALNASMACTRTTTSPLTRSWSVRCRVVNSATTSSRPEVASVR